MFGESVIEPGYFNVWYEPCESGIRFLLLHLEAILKSKEMSISNDISQCLWNNENCDNPQSDR